jgi:hypothetical protein
MSSGWLICDTKVITRTCISLVVMATACQKDGGGGLAHTAHMVSNHAHQPIVGPHTHSRSLGGAPGAVSAVISCITITFFITTWVSGDETRAGQAWAWVFSPAYTQYTQAQGREATLRSERHHMPADCHVGARHPRP